MNDSIKIFSLGGLDENGKNMMVVEINEDIFIVEAGSKYPTKFTPGINLMIPNISYLIENKSRVKGYFITHAHVESYGALPFIYNDVPATIYCSSVTASLIINAEAVGRNKPNYQFHLVSPSDTVFVGGREVIFFSVCHSMSHSSGIAIYTDKGYIVNSGEFIVDHDTSNPAFHFDLAAMSKIGEKGVLVLANESLGADKPGYCAPFHRFTPIISKSIREAKGRIFIACFYSYLYGLNEIIKVAVENRKKIGCADEFTRKSMVSITSSFDIIRIPEANRITYENILRAKEEDTVILKLGDGESLYKSVIALSEGKNEDRRLILKPEDTFILAAPASDMLEELETKTVDALFKTHCKVVYIKKNQLPSMHAREDDLKLMISIFKPKYYLPVRGCFSNLVDNAKIALSMNICLTHRDIFILDNGHVLKIDKDGKAKVDFSHKIDSGDIIIDGLGMSEETDTILHERNRFSVDGVILVGLTISKSKKKIVSKCDIQSVGFAAFKDFDIIAKHINDLTEDIVNDELKKEDFDKGASTQILHEGLTKLVRKISRKTPSIIPLIIEIE